jgi:hypothetical protein
MVPWIPIIGIIGQAIDKLFPDPQARAEAKQKLAEMQLNGELKQIELQLSAIVMEAQSNDKWTSRARPSFMYVVYLFLLSAIPFGLLYATSPDVAAAVTTGLSAWLQAIPDEMWTLFAVGYLGYTGARSFEKRKLIDRAKP